MRIVSLIFCGVVLASCSRMTDSSSALPWNAAQPSMQSFASDPLRSSGFRVLYRFKNGSDATGPFAAMTDVDGTLFGPAYNGGGHGGVIYTVTTTGKENVIFRFSGGNDGARPFGSLIDLDGTLYGTTQAGGTNDAGTVFSVTISGTHTVLYNFKGGSGDGAYPRSRLTNVNGTLFGTTFLGGRTGNGTVFKVTTSGTESVLYQFKGGKDGAMPYAGLTKVKGVLYGTTTGGGAGGYGTVYKITTSGSESVLYRFKGGNDGAGPEASLLDVDGVLYGTTHFGGKTGKRGYGTVFKLTTSGGETVLHAFNGPPDGAKPSAPLIEVNGKLYGTTTGGGLNHLGTVYQMSTSGEERVLHSFDRTNGQGPVAGLTEIDGALYGNTAWGGYRGQQQRRPDCCGIVYRLSP
jgi:uncharacterized repeat protein (TIGR03803 family)